MSERLSAEQVVRAAESLDHAYDLPAESVQALAREVQEYRAMRCDGCAKWEPCGAQGLGICGGTPYVLAGFDRAGTLADWFCKGFTPKDGAA